MIKNWFHALIFSPLGAEDKVNKALIHITSVTGTIKKAKSLINTVIRMTEEDKYCVDIMQQNLAVFV